MPRFYCSRIGFLRIVSDDNSQSAGLEFLEAEIHNKYPMATKVHVNRDRGLSSWYKNKQIWCFKDGFDGSRFTTGEQAFYPGYQLCAR